MPEAVGRALCIRAGSAGQDRQRLLLRNAEISRVRCRIETVSGTSTQSHGLCRMWRLGDVVAGSGEGRPPGSAQRDGLPPAPQHDLARPDHDVTTPGSVRNMAVRANTPRIAPQDRLPQAVTGEQQLRSPNQGCAALPRTTLDLQRPTMGGLRLSYGAKRRDAPQLFSWTVSGVANGWKQDSPGRAGPAHWRYRCDGWLSLLGVGKPYQCRAGSWRAGPGWPALEWRRVQSVQAG